MSQRQLSDMTEGETQGSENDLEEVAVKLGFGKKRKKALDKRIWNSRIRDKAGDHGLRWNTIAPSMEISLILLERRSNTCGRLKYRNFLRPLFQCNQQVAVWFVSAEAGESPYLHSLWAVKRNTGGSWQACKLEEVTSFPVLSTSTGLQRRNFSWKARCSHIEAGVRRCMQSRGVYKTSWRLEAVEACNQKEHLKSIGPNKPADLSQEQNGMLI